MNQKLRLWLPSLVLFVMTMAFILTKTGRDGLYVQADGVRSLPWAYLGMAILAPPTAGLVLLLMRSLGLHATRVAAILAMSLFQLLLAFLALPGGGFGMTVVFMLIPVVYGVILSLAWLLGAELMDGWEETSLAGAYATLGASSLGGGALGGLIGRSLGPQVGPQSLILLGAVALGASVALVHATHLRFPQPVWETRSNDTPALEQPRSRLMSRRMLEHAVRDPYTRSLLLVGVSAGLAGVLIEFLFYLTAATLGSGSGVASAFFGSIYLALAMGGLTLQILVMPRLQRAVGVGGSLMVLPLILLGGAGALAISASAFGQVGLRLAEGGIKSSIHRSNWEQSYLPLEQKSRAVAKVLVEGLAVRIAEGLAALILLLWLASFAGQESLAGMNSAWICYLLVLSVSFWFFAALVMRGAWARRRRCAKTGASCPPSHPPDCCPITASLGKEFVGRTPQARVSSRATS